MSKTLIRSPGSDDISSHCNYLQVPFCGDKAGSKVEIFTSKADVYLMLSQFQPNVKIKGAQNAKNGISSELSPEKSLP